MPRAPKKCGERGCEERVIGKAYCSEHEASRRAASSWGRGSTRQSRKLRETVLTNWPHCYLGYEGCTIISTEDDHVVPLSEGGTDHISNHRGVCAPCHRIKSQREGARANARRKLSWT